MYAYGFRLLHAPRYDDPTGERDDIRENLLGQSTLLNVLRYAVVGRRRAAVELRLVADPGLGAIHTYLLVGGGEEDADVLERLLPPEYGWARLYLSAHPAGPAPRPPAGRPLHEVHLVRRVEFVNLPGSADRLFDRPAAGAPARAMPPLIPLDPAARRAAHDRQQLCVPVLGALADPSPDRRRLCEELLFAAPVVVSVVLTPPEPADLDPDRAAATAVRRWLDPVAPALAAGSGPAATYDRFSLPTNQLCRVAVRVAGTDPAAAVGAAQCLAGQFGGLRAFDLFGPFAVPGFAPGPILPPDFARSYPGHRCRADGVTPDEDYAGFLTRLPQLYTVAEVGPLVRLPYGRSAGLPGIETRPVPPFYPPGTRRHPAGEAPAADVIRVGVHRGAPAGGRGDWHAVRLDDLTRHALITGMTGSGKTVATTFLARELDRLGVPFLVLEPVKTEYHDRLRAVVPGLRRWRLDGGPDGRPAPDFLPFDPLRLQPGVTVARHVAYLKGAFQAAFPLDEVLSLVLENGLRRYYTDPVAGGGCGLAAFTRGSVAVHRVRVGAGGRRQPFPALFDFQRFFLGRFLPTALDPRGKGGDAGARLYEWQQIFRRRFENLLGGPVGVACRRADALYLGAIDAARAAGRTVAEALPDLARAANPFARLLTGPTVVELDGVTDGEQKALVMALLLTFLFEHRQAEDAARRESGAGPAGGLRHCLVIEEAHRLLARGAAAGRAGDAAGDTARARAVALFVDMLAEVRAYGQGLVIVEQIPTKLVPEAVKNTNLKVMLRQAAADDREYLGAAMNFTPRQRAFVTTLKAGQFVAFEEGLDQPVLLSLPPEGDWDRLGLFGQNRGG